MSTTTSSWITRAETAAAVAAIREVNLQAFGKTYEPNLVEAIRADPVAWLPGLSIVATTGGHVVGHALISRCHIDETLALTLGPVAVAPGYQGRGVGSAVVRAVLEAAREQGGSTVVVLGHAGYYPRFGFRPAKSFGIQTTFEVNTENLMALTLDDARPVPSGTIHYPITWGL